jgi:hypothetical protein
LQIQGNLEALKTSTDTHTRTTIGEFGAFCQANGFILHVLDLEMYPNWMAIDFEYAKWIFFERLRTLPNYGACSDLVRAQLLIDRPGFYIDHDNVMADLNAVARSLNSNSADPAVNQSTDPQKYMYTMSQDDKGAKAVTSSFLGACPGHPLQVAYRDNIKASYGHFLSPNLKYAFGGTDHDYTTLTDKVMRDEKIKQTLYEWVGIEITGPSAFTRAIGGLKHPPEGQAPLNMNNCLTMMIVSKSAKAWTPTPVVEGQTQPL